MYNPLLVDKEIIQQIEKYTNKKEVKNYEKIQFAT
jgi:hypothetical protein